MASRQIVSEQIYQMLKIHLSLLMTSGYVKYSHGCAQNIRCTLRFLLGTFLMWKKISLKIKCQLCDIKEDQDHPWIKAWVEYYQRTNMIWKNFFTTWPYVHMDKVAFMVSSMFPCFLIRLSFCGSHYHINLVCPKRRLYSIYNQPHLPCHNL